MYICPICNEKLKRHEKYYICKNKHSFDIASKGYVNLLTTVKHNPKNAGDNNEMVRARTDFLSKDFYLPLAKKTAEIISENLSDKINPIIIDSGCGEGYYTCEYAENIPNAHIYGIDISKKAVAHCMSRIHMKNISNCDFAVASSFKLPFGKNSADLIVCTFAPVSNDEYARVLRKGGKLVVVSPSAKHLFELKSILYDTPYENKPNVYGLNNFTKTDEVIFEYKTVLPENKDIKNLFLMTPYCYKTSLESVKKLDDIDSLEITCGFCIQTYIKN